MSTLSEHAAYAAFYLLFTTFCMEQNLTAHEAVLLLSRAQYEYMSSIVSSDAIQDGLAPSPVSNATYDDAIERYYRARAAGAKITLKQIAEMYQFSPSYLRKRKMEYDARGGWGSRKKKPTIADIVAASDRLQVVNDRLLTEAANELKAAVQAAMDKPARAC